MSGPRAGRLRDRVTIQSPPAANAYGQKSGSWSDVASRNCSIEPINGREYFAQDGEHGDLTVRIRFRYESNLIPTGYRLVNYRVSPAVIYDVENVINPGNEDRELIVMARQRT